VGNSNQGHLGNCRHHGGDGGGGCIEGKICHYLVLSAVLKHCLLVISQGIILENYIVHGLRQQLKLISGV